jgi:peroxiredoxin
MLYYQDCGEGRPVVLIHGWPLSHRMWEPQITALTEAGYRVIAYDRRGYGDSSMPWTGYDYDTLTDDLHGLLTELDLDDAVIAGFSMGGGEVARYFGRYGTERVGAAMLISAVPPFMLKTPDNPEGVPQKVFDEMMEGVKDDRIAFLDDFGKQFVNWDDADPPISEDLLHYAKTIASFASPRATRRCITAFGETDFRPDMPENTVPTLVVHGDADQVVPIEASGKKSAQMIPNARLEIIEGAPHGLNLTHTEQLNTLMVDFLNGLK